MGIAVKEDVGLDADALCREISKKHREVATDPSGSFHFHTGRYLARHPGYDETTTASLPDAATESFAGVANVFSLRSVRDGERVVDLGAGAGFDCFVAARQAGPTGKVVGVDMTQELLAKSRATASAMGATNVEFREGLIERLPVEEGWADLVISNGVINLCPYKAVVFAEIHRVLRSGGWLEFADIVNGNPVPDATARNIDLWTA